MQWRNFLSPLAVAFVLLLGWGSAASAATLTYDMWTEFEGTSPAGYVTVTISDGADCTSGSGVGGACIAGEVELSLDGSTLGDTEKLQALYLNVDLTEAQIASLSFTNVSGDTASGINNALDCCKADGDGHFDIQISFNNFLDNDTSVYLISGGGITVAAFVGEESQDPSGGAGSGYLAAEHIGGIGPDGDSGWIAPVPLPAALPLYLASLAALGFFIRRRPSSA